MVERDVGYLSYLLPQAPVDHSMCDVWVQDQVLNVQRSTAENARSSWGSGFRTMHLEQIAHGCPAMSGVRL